jgi:hypothetical protein
MTLDVPGTRRSTLGDRALLLRQLERGTACRLALNLCRRFRHSDGILTRICLMQRTHCDFIFCTVPRQQFTVIKSL